MKKIIVLIICGVILSIYSCDDILDVEPVSSLVYGSFWRDAESAKVGMVGLHADMRSTHEALVLMGEVRSDLYGGVGFESPSSTNLIYQDIRVDNAPFGGWAGFYTKLQRINDAIKHIPGIDFTSSNDKDYLLGQVYGMRAFYYYTMLKTWGGVPLVTEPTESIDYNTLEKPRASEQEIMNQIKLDIEASLKAFGSQANFYNNKRTYWSKAASLILKGDVYIWSGVHLGGGVSDFQTAKSALEEVGTISGVNLLSKYADVFKYSNKNNNEVIFAFNYAVDDGATSPYFLWTARQVEISALYNSEGTAIGTSFQFSSTATNRYHPSSEALNTLFEDPLDERGNATWIRLFRNPDATQYAGAVTNKFLGTVISGIRQIIDDAPLYRYSDAILLLAETKNLLAQDPSPEINDIRERAYGTNYDASIHGYINQTKSLNTEAILKERFKEFQQEGKRWWDLRRAGDEYAIKQNNYLLPGDEYKLVLPITRDMIGRNPALIQTPGYGN